MNLTSSDAARHQAIKNAYVEQFGGEHLLVRSPGRVNLIGEHTDYNQGLVLPAALDRDIVLAIGKRADDHIHLYAMDQGEHHETTVQAGEWSPALWPDYLIGVVQQLRQRGHLLGGFNAVFSGNIPQGAGLSSSAALECATAFALSELFGLELDKLEIALVAQAAENEFVGVKCGLMDQFASVFGQEAHLIKLDCRDFSYEYIPFKQEGIRVVLFDTQVKHSLASSAYNTRREECEYGVSLIAKIHPQVTSMREATLEQVKQIIKPVDEVVFRRCHYVVSEIQRVEEACVDLKNGDFEAFGKRMFETHDGLKHDYEVSCRELDVLVDLVRHDPAVLGARMMGGGFGGCTINLVREDEVDRVVNDVSRAYLQQTAKSLQAYVGRVGDGTGRLA